MAQEPLKVYTAVDFARLNLETPWAVEGLVPAYGISLIYAMPKVGKSIMSVQLAHALGTGTDFLTCKVPHKLKVIYVQSDLPEPEWAHQLSVLNINEGWDTVWLTPGAINQPRPTMELIKILKPYDFVILDSLMSTFGWPEIRNETVVGHLLDRIRALTTVPIWLIHHKRKGMAGVPDASQNAALGNVALGAGVSVLFDLTPRALHAFGRVISAELDLDRTASGLWKVDKSFKGLT